MLLEMCEEVAVVGLTEIVQTLSPQSGTRPAPNFGIRKLESLMQKVLILSSKIYRHRLQFEFGIEVGFARKAQFCFLLVFGAHFCVSQGRQMS